jgi:hypothetical protein
MIKSEINLHWNFCGKRVWGEVLSSSLGTQTSGRLGPRKVQEGGEEKEWKWNVFVRVLCHSTTCKCKDFLMAVCEYESGDTNTVMNNECVCSFTEFIYLFCCKMVPIR